MGVLCGVTVDGGLVLLGRCALERRARRTIVECDGGVCSIVWLLDESIWCSIQSSSKMLGYTRRNLRGTKKQRYVIY